MTPWRITVGLLAAVSAMSATAPVSAQDWADANYRYRRPITVLNPSAAPYAAGDIAAFSYAPRYKEFEKTRPDGADVKIYYHNGTSNVEVPQVQLPMGTAAAKILFALQTPMTGTVFNLTENASAGKTDFASIVTQTPDELTMDYVRYADDDASTTVTLPFSFPFRGQSSNKIEVSIDGYLQPGGRAEGQYLRYDIDDPAKFAAASVIGPWTGDLGAYDTATMGVYYTADATQAIFRWHVTDTANTAGVVMDFAAILKPDGSVRFVYGDSVDVAAGQTMKVGVAVGDATLGKTSTSTTAYDTHSDITYTQAYNASTATGYYAYYGNPSDDGKANRTAPPADKVVGYTFDDNTTQGWQVVNGNGVLAAANGKLILSAPGVTGVDHPMAVATTQTTLLTDQVVYARLQGPRGSNEVAVMARANPDHTGYALQLDGWNGIWGGSLGYGTHGAMVKEGEGNWNPLGQHVTWDHNNEWSVGIMKITGAGENITLQSRFFIEGSADPGRWIITDNVTGNDVYGKPKTNRRFDSGSLGLAGYTGGSTDLGAQVLDYVYATSPSAENASWTSGAEETIAATGFGTVSGTATIGEGPAPFVTVALSAGGRSYLARTDNTGAFSALVPAGTYTATVAERMGAGTATDITVTEGATATATVSLTPANMVLNPSFEVGDPVRPNVKPLGWYRRDYGAEANAAADKETLPWFYEIDGFETHSGERAIGFGEGAGLRSWDPEGSIPEATVSDNLGQGPLVPTLAGGVYTVSTWMKRTDASGNPRLRVRDMSADNAGDGALVGAGITIAGTTTTGAWAEITGDHTAAGPFLSVRPYGDAIGAGQWVYFDDVSVKVKSLAGIPAPAPEFLVYVTDANGSGLAGVPVVLSDGSTPNPLADTAAYKVTDTYGRVWFSLQPDAAKTYTLHAWRNGYFADSAPLDLAGPTTLVYDAPATANALRGRPVVSFYKEGGSEPAPYINDGNEGTRWAGAGTPTTSATPQLGWVVVDLGKPAAFGTEIPQIDIVWETARAATYEVRVGNDDPSAITEATAATWGTPIYTSPTNAGDLNVNIGGKLHDVATNLTPATGRYLMLLMTKYQTGLGNYSVWELKAEATVGTAAGIVKDEAGAGVSGAYLTEVTSGQQIATTDATGAFTITGAAGFPYRVDAHMPTAEAATVHPVSVPVTVTPTVAGATGATLILPNTVDNQVDFSANAFAWWAFEPTVDWNEAANGPLLAVDATFDTRWLTKAIPDAKQPWNNISAATPFYYAVDLGAAKTFDQAVIHWEWARSGGYAIEVSNDFDPANLGSGTWTAVYNNNVPVGYRADMKDVGTRLVDAVTFPETTARYIRIRMYEPGGNWNLGRLSIWELQLANVGTLPQPPLPPIALAAKALAVAGGLATTADAAEFNTLNAAGGTTIDVADALALARQG